MATNKPKPTLVLHTRLSPAELVELAIWQRSESGATTRSEILANSLRVLLIILRKAGKTTEQPLTTALDELERMGLTKANEQNKRTIARISAQLEGADMNAAISSALAPATTNEMPTFDPDDLSE